MAEVSKSEFISKMTDQLSEMDEIEEFQFSVNDVPEVFIQRIN